MLQNDVPLVLSLISVIWFAALAKGAYDLWAMVVLFGGLTLITLIFLAQRARDKKPLVLPLGAQSTALLLAFLASARFSFDVNTSRQELQGWFFCLLAFFLFCNILRAPARRLQFLKYAGLVVGPVSVVAIIQYARVGFFTLSKHWAAPSTFTNPSVLAGFALSWIFVFWHFRRRSMLYQCLFVGCVITLLLARSWWAFASLAAGFAFYYQKALRAYFAAKPSILIAASGAGIAALAIVLYVKPSSDRLGWWIAGLQMFAQHPWTGVGLGSYATAFPFFKVTSEQNTLFAHSFPIQIVSETGLIGALCLGSCIFAYARLLKNEEDTSERMAYQASLITIFVFSLTAVYLEYMIGKLMLFLMLALALSSVNLKSVLLPKKSLVAAAVGLLMLIPAWYLPFRASQYYVAGLDDLQTGNSENAASDFQNAIALNPSQDEGYAALSDLYRRTYDRDHNSMDLARSLFYMQQAFERKKDVRYAADLTHFP